MTEQSNLTLPRTRNPWGQGEKLRTEILAASARLLSELGGEEGLTIRGVARAVGIAPASIYQHFADKAALVAGLLDYDYQLLAEAMRNAHDSLPTQDSVGRLRAQMRAYCRFAIENPGHYRLMLNSRQSVPDSTPRDQGPLASIAKLVIAACEECEAAGHRLRVPARKAAIMVFVGAHGRVALWHSSPDQASAEEIVPFVEDLISLVFADSAD
jgi:AcrR family transcriptional regulator